MDLGLGLGLGRDDQTASVTVPPAITAQPTLTNAILNGQSKNLSITATGGGLSYQWYEGLSGDTSTPVGGATSATYSASPASSKFYWCRATNARGTADSDEALVYVFPVITALYAVNAAGTATTNIMLMGINIGNAANGYTTLSAAVAAASSGTTIVYTGAITDTTAVTITAKNIDVYVADGFRHDGTQAGSGATLASSSANTLTAQTGSVVNVYGLRIACTSTFATTARTVGNSTVMSLYGCVVAKDGNYQAVETNGDGTSNSMRLYNCIVYADDGADGIVCNRVGTETLICWNVTLHGQSSCARGFWNNNSSSAGMTLNGCIATGSFSTNAFDPGSGAFAAGSSHNHGGANAPGTGSTTSAITDSTYMVDATDSLADGHCISRAQFDNYAGPTPVAAKALDIDLTAHVEAYAGADYVAA